jgi:hypothetical protein
LSLQRQLKNSQSFWKILAIFDRGELIGRRL